MPALIHEPRSGFHASLLTGAVLLLTLSHLPLRAEEEAGKWTEAGKLSVGRYAPGAGLLPDGRVLVAGGFSFETGRTHASAELFTPAEKSWEAGPNLRWDRNFPLVLPLSTGDLLFVDGFRARVGTTATAEHLEAARMRFRTGEPAAEERELCAATQLADGRFLICGGYSTVQKKTLDTAELFDPKTEQFKLTAGRLHHARFGHTGVLLPDGRVLIVGGKVEQTNADVLPAELFDPRSGTFTETGALRVGRDRCTAWTVDGGKRVLVAGGSAHEGGTPPAKRCELFDPASGTFTDGPELVRDRMAHAATPLGDGRVLLTGGWSGSESRTTPQAELWDPKASRFIPAGRQLAGRHDHAAVLLKDGRVLVIGGKEAPASNGVETPLETEIWSPN